ncbi:MAG: hypothetical protein ACLFRE_10565 [Desulfovermiculus sp.]
MEGLNKVNKAYFGKDGEVIFLRNDKKIAMICPFSQNDKNCSHHCPLLVEMYETATMETSEKYVKFCNGELIELVGDERK